MTLLACAINPCLEAAQEFGRTPLPRRVLRHVVIYAVIPNKELIRREVDGA
jgi:hypothetical protein